MKLCCVSSLGTPHRGVSHENTRHFIINVKKSTRYQKRGEEKRPQKIKQEKKEAKKIKWNGCTGGGANYKK